MKNMLKIYFSHKSIWLYAISLLICLMYSFYLQVLPQYYYLLLVPIIAAPFYEWFLHRYVLHIKIPQKYTWLYKLMQELHYGHHEDPDNIPLIFAPVWSVVLLYTSYYLTFSFIFWSFAKGLVCLVGAMAYYLFYEWVHLGHHVKGYQHFTRFGKMMKKLHMWHHYKNENYWWGITNPLGDILFKTMPNVKSKEKSTTVKNIAEYHDLI